MQILTDPALFGFADIDDLAFELLRMLEQSNPRRGDIAIAAGGNQLDDSRLLDAAVADNRINQRFEIDRFGRRGGDIEVAGSWTESEREAVTA